MKILICDDSKAVQAFVKSVLAPKGFEMQQVFDGSQALAALESQTFDLMLLDWEMPILNGPDTFLKIREAGHAFPIVMMTTKNAPEDILFMLKRGAAEYILKPFTAEILLERLDQVRGAA